MDKINNLLISASETSEKFVENPLNVAKSEAVKTV